MTEIFHSFGNPVNVLFYTHINTCLNAKRRVCTLNQLYINGLDKAHATDNNLVQCLVGAKKNQPAKMPAGFFQAKNPVVLR